MPPGYANVQKPIILGELVLHLIRVGKYRLALDELETYATAWKGCHTGALTALRYLSSFTYLSSAPLLTYAGLLYFYLAQPESARGGSETIPSGTDGSKGTHGAPRDEESETSSTRSRSMSVDSGQCMCFCRKHVH